MFYIGPVGFIHFPPTEARVSTGSLNMSQRYSNLKLQNVITHRNEHLTSVVIYLWVPFLVK